jgi:hypothetical protein
MVEREHEKASHHAGGGHERNRALAWCSGPQSQLLERAPGNRHASQFGASFLLDEGHVAIKRQFFPVQTFERNLLDERCLVPNFEELLRGVHKENYRLTGKTPV